MLSCQQFTESVYVYSPNTIDSAWTVSGNIMLRCEVNMFLALNALKCRSHSAEDAWHSVDDRTLG